MKSWMWWVGGAVAVGVGYVLYTGSKGASTLLSQLQSFLAAHPLAAFNDATQATLPAGASATAYRASDGSPTVMQAGTVMTGSPSQNAAWRAAVPTGANWAIIYLQSVPYYMTVPTLTT
jgi:hypothetical protein